MNYHQLKLNEEFCDAVLSGEKNFEVRINDRGFQKGDQIIFTPISNLGVSFSHQVGKKTYEITYVLSGWGIKEDYVAFGIKEVQKYE